MFILRPFLIFIFLFLVSCKPPKEIAQNSKKVYKTILKFMDENKEPPPKVKKYLDKQKKKL